MWSATQGGEDSTRLLLDKGANLNATPLLADVQKWHQAIVKLLLEHGANVEVTDSNGFTPLTWAAYRGHADVARLVYL
jgi:ankyrin repeat protein